MPLYIMIPTIMGVAIISVVGIRVLYSHTAEKGESHNRVNELTRNVEELTHSLTNFRK